LTCHYNNDNHVPSFIAQHAAAERGHLEVLSLLLERGASVNDASMRGITPLHSVAMHGQGNVKKVPGSCCLWFEQ
jgi:ankyrin repeat protein